VTKKGGGQLLESEESVEVGSFGGQQYTASARGRAEPLTYGVTSQRRVLDGYRDYSWSRNTTVTAHGGVRTNAR
jgi:hypothetical protein